MKLIIALCLFLTACDGGDGGRDDRQPPAPRGVWELGPTIDGRNYSKGSVYGNVITVDDVHYITRPTGSLTGKGSVSVTFTISGPVTATPPREGPNVCAGQFATASLYFQRRPDDWKTDGTRWWATFATVHLNQAGTYTMVAPLDGLWTSVFKMTAASNPREFAEAKANASRVGMTLGNCEGYGHGGTGPATLTIDSFKVE